MEEVGSKIKMILELLQFILSTVVERGKYKNILKNGWIENKMKTNISEKHVFEKWSIT